MRQFEELPRRDLEFERFAVAHAPSARRFRVSRGEVDALYMPVTAYFVAESGEPVFLEPLARASTSGSTSLASRPARRTGGRRSGAARRWSTRVGSGGRASPPTPSSPRRSHRLRDPRRRLLGDPAFDEVSRHLLEDPLRRR
jgi:hypothetical protein